MDFFLTKPVSKFALMQTIADLITKQERKKGKGKVKDKGKGSDKKKPDLLLPQSALPRDAIIAPVLPDVEKDAKVVTDTAPDQLVPSIKAPKALPSLETS